jgi:hypothetical protein
MFDHLPEKWFMLWWLFLTICQSGSYSCGCFYFVVDNLPEEFGHNFRTAQDIDMI